MNFSSYKQSLKGFIKFQPLLRELVVRDIKVRYRHSFLGLVWTVLNPLLMMTVLSVVFSSMFKSTISNFPVYVLIGSIVFNFNSEATTQGMNSILWNASLIKKVYIPKYLFPMSNVVSSLVNFGFSFISLIIVMLITKAPFHITIVTIWIPLVYLFMFSFGLGLILCAINVYFRDMAHIYGVFVTAWMYLTPIFYSIDIAPSFFRKAIVINPMYHFVMFFRKIIMDGIFPGVQSNLILILLSIGMLFLGLFTFSKLQDNFILRI